MNEYKKGMTINDTHKLKINKSYTFVQILKNGFHLFSILNPKKKKNWIKLSQAFSINNQHLFGVSYPRVMFK